MKKRERQPTIPRTAGETARRAIMALLLEGPISAREISAAVGFGLSSAAMASSDGSSPARRWTVRRVSA